jgi:hypothetical protein
MPMIDIYAPAGIFPDVHRLASDAAAAVKEIEQVPDIAMFRQNTGAFMREMPWGPSPMSMGTAVTLEFRFLRKQARSIAATRSRLSSGLRI